MLSVIRNFVREEDALEMVEWAIVAALIVTVSATAVATLSNTLVTKFNDVDTLITGLP
jgi:Flp pilus assembly pilin Flp